MKLVHACYNDASMCELFELALGVLAVLHELTCFSYTSVFCLTESGLLFFVS